MIFLLLIMFNPDESWDLYIDNVVIDQGTVTVLAGNALSGPIRYDVGFLGVTEPFYVAFADHPGVGKFSLSKGSYWVRATQDETVSNRFIFNVYSRR